MPFNTEKYDIVVIGAGPVGLVLSTCLVRWGYKIKHIDNRPSPTATGRADGIQPRSLDFLKNLGLKRQIMAHDPARVYEVAFWDPSKDGIHRTRTWASCPDFIGARYPFTTLLHQGLIERVFIADIEKHGGRIQRPWTITGFVNDGKDAEYPVEVWLKKEDGEETEVVRSKYLFGGEGARSFVREQLKIPMIHKDDIAHVWGVMDGVVRTNFPDIKMKCNIHSNAGSIMVIPREANMVRLYIQVASSTDPDWDPKKKPTAEEVQAIAKRIFKPYTLEWDRLEWYSAYPIGQGIAERYTLDERVILGGDACHTHSPKAGQGMNTAFLDAQNLSWKIHHIERSFAARSILQTYESERKKIAENLLAFDAKYAKLFSERLPAAAEVASADQAAGTEPQNQFVKTFIESCEFTSGYGVAYPENVFNWSERHPAKSAHFLRYPEQCKLRTGRILTPATVTRVTDCNVVHLEQEIPVNGSFRIYIFAGKPSVTVAALASFANHSQKPKSYFSSYLREDINAISHHERHNPHSHFYTFCTIFNAKHADVNIKELCPEMLARYADHVYADDVGDDGRTRVQGTAHAKMGLSVERGGVVVVRPDGYVGCVAELVEGSGTVNALNGYFGAFVTKKLEGSEGRAHL